MSAESTMHVLVRGEVQGVGFRWFVREAARELDVAGWVRNRADGSVEVAAEGSAAAIEKLRQRLAAGPPSAVVTNVEDVHYDAGDDAAEPRRRPFTILK